MQALTTAAAGFGLGLSLIVAIGAQNAYVLRQGLRGEHVAAVVAVCVISDAILIAAGVAGLGAVVENATGVVTVIRVVGAAFLLGYAILAARRALRPSTLDPDNRTDAVSLAAAITTCLALTWLNPHVYLDTVLLVGSIAQGYASRWAFATGAALASLVWFITLGFGARYLRPLFAKPLAWKLLDGAIAAIMLTIAVSLLLPLL